ncbi:hypothetical protein ES332_A05G262100v1 [Gossypium tomentosum]|uniref:Chalcone/stilbene synthase N-terminal domain-containing protein n=1 Tax=Gossypium tomentosum TaxID=34277 RepID=A0A5D2QJL0_GOSTO|nr:hypothetical protein ES332_A05G262100v1 [Gossypium tomentosum]
MATENNLEACAVEKLATILAIGTTNPPNCFYQVDYPDFYFRVTKSEHMTQLKDKFQRICEKSAIKKHYMHLNEAMLKENPCLTIYKAPSSDVHQDILVKEVPKLGMEAALKAIKEWGQPFSKITYLIFCTSSGIDMPSADHKLAKLIGLKPSIQRFMIYNQGCLAGATALRLAKDLVENNVNMVISFQPPLETNLDILIGSTIFSDGAAALIVGANPIVSINECPFFQIVSSSQTIIPESDDILIMKIREMGMEYYISRNLPKYVSNNIKQCIVEAFTPFGISKWENLFYVVHPGGERLRASRHVLSEYGNMWGPSVIFVLNEMRKMSVIEGKATTGEGLEWGVLFGIGPGLTVETLVLRNFATNSAP